MSDSYIDNLNKLANNFTLKKDLEEKQKNEFNRNFDVFIQEFQKVIEKIVKNGFFNICGNQKVVKGTIYSAVGRGKDSDGDISDFRNIAISTFPDNFSVSIDNSVEIDWHYDEKYNRISTYADFKKVIGPFYSVEEKMINKGSLLRLGKPKYEYICREDIEKTTAFVCRFNEELKDFAKITKQYNLEYRCCSNDKYYSNIYHYNHCEKSFVQKYDFEVSF